MVMAGMETYLSVLGPAELLVLSFKLLKAVEKYNPIVIHLKTQSSLSVLFFLLWVSTTQAVSNKVSCSQFHNLF